jgi:hypothetical protein
MITFSKFGKHGRLGNQLFQYASMIGMSLKYNQLLGMPDWCYSKYFENYLSTNLHNVTSKLIEEKAYNYTPIYYDHLMSGNQSNVFDFFGYFQSEKYWQHCKEEVKKALTFNKTFKLQVQAKYQDALAMNDAKKEVIAISIRRGDYVNNPNYAQIPITWYFTALNEHLNWKQANIIIFSDDIDYCKLHFGCFKNVYYADNNFNNTNKSLYFAENQSAIEQLCLMSMCDHFIIANSTFSWWGAYLGEKEHSIVIRPTEHLDGKLKASHDTKDYYPERWLAYAGDKIDLSDVTFMIPVCYDHKDRSQNLSLNVCLLERSFRTNIIVGENMTDRFQHYSEYASVIYKRFNYQDFHRTKMLNEMAKISKTNIIVNWDADVFISPLQILYSVEKIREGQAQMVFPYDGRFARVQRIPWYKSLSESLDIGIVGNHQFKGMWASDASSVGGAIIFDKAAYWKGGGENENFISYGPEDVERDVRFRRAGFEVYRTPGVLYHLDHWRGPNSKAHNKFYDINHKELDKIYGMTKKELLEYIKTWKWKQS